MELLDYFLIGITGLAGGFLAGFLGIGGGIVYVLILPIAFSHLGIAEEQSVQLTIANSIFGVFFAAMAASITYWIRKEFYLREIILVSIAGAIGAILTFEFIVKNAWYSKDVFNAFLIVLLGYLLYNTLKNRKQEMHPEKNQARNGNQFFLMAGFGGGIVSALSGLGGGTVLIPFLNAMMKLKIQRAKAISLGMIVFTSLALTIVNLTADPSEISVKSVGYIIFPVALPLSLGVVLGSPFGVKFGSKVSAYTTSISFSIFIFIVILSKIWDTYLYFTGH